MASIIATININILPSTGTAHVPRSPIKVERGTNRIISGVMRAVALDGIMGGVPADAIVWVDPAPTKGES